MSSPWTISSTTLLGSGPRKRGPGPTVGDGRKSLQGLLRCGASVSVYAVLVLLVEVELCTSHGAKQRARCGHRVVDEVSCHVVDAPARA